MQGLKKLDMRATAVADLSPLAGMRNLHHLDISTNGMVSD
jgi:hypothetical protein